MANRTDRKKRIRAKVIGDASRPRVVVFRSNSHLYLQAVDDSARKTIAASSDLKSPNLAEDLAKKLTTKKIKKVVFDRGGYQYHGKIKKLAEDLRAAGLEF